MNKQSSNSVEKEISIIKSENSLGLTLSDRGTGPAFIKKIKKGSVIDRTPNIMVGDYIEKVNNVWVIGARHHVVARLLKQIPTGATFSIRLVAQMNSGFQGTATTTKSDSNRSINGNGSGKQIFTFKPDGFAVVEEIHDEGTELAIDAINSLLDSFLGINDSELARQIWALGTDKMDLNGFTEAIDVSDLADFGFTDGFIIDLWNAITTIRQDRRKQ